jgi:hypothetical protein
MLGVKSLFLTRVVGGKKKKGVGLDNQQDYGRKEEA